MAPKKGIHCIEGLKHTGQEISKMLRCCSCNKWHHYDCVNEDAKHEGIWNCPICARQGETIMSMMHDVLALKINMGTLLRFSDQCKRENDKLSSKVTELSEEMKSLQNTNASLLHLVSEQQQENSRLR